MRFLSVGQLEIATIILVTVAIATYTVYEHTLSRLCILLTCTFCKTLPTQFKLYKCDDMFYY